MAQYVEVCKLESLDEDVTKVFDVIGKRVMLVRHNGDVYAMSAYCTHDGEEIEGAKVCDNQVECPRHGARFSVKTGEVTQMPAVFGLAKYDVKVEKGFIYVDME